MLQKLCYKNYVTKIIHNKILNQNFKNKKKPL